MKIISHNSYTRKNSILRKINLMIILLLFLASSVLIPNSNNITEIDRDFDNFSQTPLLADDSPILFEGNENALNITEYGNLYKYNQEVSLTNQEELNLNYYLDSAHDWKAYKVENTLENIVDKRNWINNSGFQSPIIYRVNDTLDIYGTDHNYLDNHNPSWNSPEDEIHVSGASYIRVHFSRLQFEYGYDFVYITNSTQDYYYYVNSTSSNVYNFYSPWIFGDTIKLDYDSDGSENFYGYDIDYYEFMNSSSNIDINSANWEFHYQEVFNGWNDHGPGEVDNASAMYIALYGDFVSETEVAFDTGAYSELFQNFTIDSGPFVEAYLSFDYYCQYALPTNDHYIYVKINNEKIFSKGMLDISELGKRKWLTSGRLFTDSWDNLTNIFKEDLKQFNISVGFRIGSGYTYTSGYGIEDSFTNIVWFDNISLVVTTKSNATQPGVDLTINSQSLQDSSEWGLSSQTINQIWDINPIILTLNTSSPNLEFDLNTTVYGYHYGKSRIDQQNTEGVLYEILENSTIYWEYYHNLYIPNQYADIEFFIDKPINWEIISALDPTLQEIPFKDGKAGDISVKINTSYAIFPGWWTFKATSPNYLSQSNTKLLKQGEWTHASFITGESTRIKTQVNYSGEIPNNIESTEVNLTIFDPEGNQWYSEVNSPLSNGTVFFSEITLSALNTTGGQFEYTLIWSNGTALGGVKSNFIVNHYGQIKLLKPDDAKIDLRTDGFVGEIISVRIILTDPENGLSISGATVSYNWVGGTTHNFTEASIGVYETIIDTTDLSSRGLYKILISSSKLGFIESNLTIELNLGEQFDLIWIIIIISALIIGALGVLSLRSYVILPRRRIREAELLARTQRFKDLQNIQAIVAIHRYSGIPLYSKSYSILEKQKKELFSGFIQAIITVGEEMAGKREKGEDLDDEDSSRTILELDFKYFYCLICDRQDLRVIFILTERASDRLKKVISNLSLGAMMELSEQLENWDGAIHEFELMFPPIINKYVELYFKEKFTINNVKFISKLRKEGELDSMETRILNVLYSIAKSKTEFYLENIFNIIHEKNRDIVIDGIEGLIKKQVIMPSTK